MFTPLHDMLAHSFHGISAMKIATICMEFEPKKDEWSWCKKNISCPLPLGIMVQTITMVTLLGEAGIRRIVRIMRIN